MYFTIINEFRCSINYVLLKYISSTTLIMILKLSIFLLNALAYIKFTHTPVENSRTNSHSLESEFFNGKRMKGFKFTFVTTLQYSTAEEEKMFIHCTVMGK